ncbi:MAG: tetratricopeptide repeat protein, partial [Thermoanaerobaculia bacterium]
PESAELEEAAIEAAAAEEPESADLEAAEPAEPEAPEVEVPVGESLELAADAAARADELVTEASVLSNYSLESKAAELLETALELAPDHVEAARLLLHLHHQAERPDAVCEVAERFLRDGELPEPLDQLLQDWSYSVAEGRISAPAVEPTAPEPVLIGAEEPPSSDTRLTWLDEHEAGSSETDAAMFGEEDQFFDLAAELEEELIAEESRLDGAGLPQLEEQSIEEIVEGFKQGVAETLSSEDYDTHFNLGIAYREMGLVDEAIGEFQLAAKSKQYLVDCCSLLGASFLEKGFPDLAVKWYQRGLTAPDASDEEKLGLLYELGNLYLSTGDKDTARDTFAEIYGANSNYRDVVAKLEELR